MAADQKKLLAQLDQTRTKISSIKGQLLNLDRQQIAPSDVPKRVEQVVQHLAERMDTAWLGSALAFPEFKPFDRDDIVAEACTGGPSPGVLLSWLFPDLMRERLAELVAGHATGTIPLAQRPAERQRLEQDLYAAEVQEEALICQLEDQGVEVLRRSDADPSVILTAHLEN